MSLISNIHLGSTAIILCTTFFIGNVQSFNWTLGSSTPFSEISEQKHYIRSGQQRNPALNYLQDVPLHACIALYTNLARLILQFYVWYTMSIYVDKNMVMIYILQLLQDISKQRAPEFIQTSMAETRLLSSNCEVVILKMGITHTHIEYSLL